MQRVEVSRLDVLEGDLMEKLWQLKRIIYVLSAKLLEDANVQNEYLEDLQRLFDEFATVFEIPIGLPLKRYYDHQIPLINPNISVSARLYRYPFFQKNEIEKQVKEMLDTDIIRSSCSLFASPVVLVRKSDRSWRMFIDYRALNRNTAKNKFPIPLIDDLLDEFCGARFFLKFDLRSGCHQIRLVEENIMKTAFKTHEGHYEFLVMAFRLTNLLLHSNLL